MVRIFRHYVSPVKLGLVALDSIFVFLAFFAAVSLRQYGEPIWHAADVEWLNLAVSSALMVLCMIATGCYSNESVRDLRMFFLHLLAGLVLGMLTVSAYLFLVKALGIWRSSLAISLGINFAFMFASRALLAPFILQRFPRRALIVGQGALADRTIDYLRDHPELGIIALQEGYTGAAQEEEGGSGAQAARAFLKRVNPDLLVACDILHNSPDSVLLLEAGLHGHDLRDGVEFLEQLRGHVDLGRAEPAWFLFESGLAAGGLYERAAKRTFDILIALSLLVLTLPLALAAALAVGLTSAGPVFYRQQRVGREGQVFWLFKFRSMVRDAEAMHGPQWTEDKDPRITVVGRLLRRTRIDELPQLLNVLLGQMSMVGPRPERPVFVEQLSDRLPFYSVRHAVKPGISGWAQVRYPYAASIEDGARKLEYDLYYIRRYSLFLDFLIILQTVRVIIFGQGVR